MQVDYYYANEKKFETRFKVDLYELSVGDKFVCPDFNDTVYEVVGAGEKYMDDLNICTVLTKNLTNPTYSKVAPIEWYYTKRPFNLVLLKEVSER